MFRPIQLLVILALLLSCKKSTAPIDKLRCEINQIIGSKKATIALSITDTNETDTLSINGDKHCPLQSVFKFHIAVVVLAEIDKGKLSLNQKIDIKKEEMLPDLWSPLRDEYPDGGSFTIGRLIQYSVSQSDNVACDVLISSTLLN